MALPTEGQISLRQIQQEYADGRSEPIRLSEYFKKDPGVNDDRGNRAFAFSRSTDENIIDTSQGPDYVVNDTRVIDGITPASNQVVSYRSGGPGPDFGPYRNFSNTTFFMLQYQNDNFGNFLRGYRGIITNSTGHVLAQWIDPSIYGIYGLSTYPESWIDLKQSSVILDNGQTVSRVGPYQHRYLASPTAIEERYQYVISTPEQPGPQTVAANVNVPVGQTADQLGVAPLVSPSTIKTRISEVKLSDYYGGTNKGDFD